MPHKSPPRTSLRKACQFVVDTSYLKGRLSVTRDPAGYISHKSINFTPLKADTSLGKTLILNTS